MKYDSKQDVVNHQNRVDDLIGKIIAELNFRAMNHDASKLKSPEKEIFDEHTSVLALLVYGSEEYQKCLEQLSPALKHHYSSNPHHPEYHQKGINGMTLIDIVEMFCDWKAATERHNTGNFQKSIEYNKGRFQMSDQLAEIFENTRKAMGW